MIKLIVKLLIAYPKLAELFCSIRDSYYLALAEKRNEEYFAIIENLKKGD